MTRSLEFYRSVPRYVAARTVGKHLPGLLAGPVAPLRLVVRDDLAPPTEEWSRLKPLLSGICGSDLNTISGTSSFYFGPMVSMPFVPGHEVVAEVTDGELEGARVVVDPVLSCSVRGVEPKCGPCSEGLAGLCERLTAGDLDAGLQTGYCASTGGGWSEGLLAHKSQLHLVPEDMPDESAVLVEPMACALHSVKRAVVEEDARVLVVGAGTVGLLTLIALKEKAAARRVTVIAKYSGQAQLARSFGADQVISPAEAVGAVRRATRAFRLDPERSMPFLLGGVDVSFDCVGNKSSLDLCLRTTRARGKVVLSGMPAEADLSPAWFRELEVVGAYSGSGEFADAISLAHEANLGKLVGVSYPLSRWREAVDHAFQSGTLGTVKVCFDPRLE